MLRTKNLAAGMSDVPNTWVFEHYLNLPEALTGQDVQMLSIFSAADTNPSFFVYHVRLTNTYKFKDFSSGKQGDGIGLIKEMFNLPRRYDAATKIINDYNDYTLNNGTHSVAEFRIHERYKVKAIKPRNWNVSDARYWTQYRIGTDLLEKYNVHPMEYFVLTKEGSDDRLVIRNTKIYGFFRKDGSLYKIYQPLLTENKFFKVSDYIQGMEQTTGLVPYLVICSSLKDIMAFEKMGFKNAEAIAPDSENVMLSERVITDLKSKYKSICVLFDNDAAGIRSMLKYKEQYNIAIAHYKIEKDLSDSVKIHGVNNTRELLYPVLTKALTGTIKSLPE